MRRTANEDRIQIFPNVSNVPSTPTRQPICSRWGKPSELNGGFLRTGSIYQITARLPPLGDSPQYRIRNDDEKFERVARQSELELSNATSDGASATLVEKSFGLVQR